MFKKRKALLSIIILCVVDTMYVVEITISAEGNFSILELAISKYFGKKTNSKIHRVYLC